MNRKQRIEIATRLSKIAAERGAKVTIREDDPRWRNVMVEADFDSVQVSIDVDDKLGVGLCAHWYGAKRPLRHIPAFDSVNECHRRKATQYRPGILIFYRDFEAACDAVKSGAAFDDSWQPRPMRVS